MIIITDFGISFLGGFVHTHTFLSVSQGKYMRSLAVSMSVFNCSFVILLKSLSPAIIIVKVHVLPLQYYNTFNFS